MDFSWAEIVQYGLLFASAFLAGGINAVAGGGTLLTFPALYSVLGPAGAVIANATSTVALFPGSISAIGAFWEDLKLYRRWVTVLMPPSLVGGLLGALLLTYLPASTFKAAVPWLILVAASLFTLQPQIAKWLGIGKAHAAPAAGTMVGVVAFQFVVGIYGGYFGAGIGILMLSALAVMGLTDIHAMNGLKSVLGTCINGIAVAVFVVQDFFKETVNWPLAIWMAVAAAAGAFVAARIAKRIDRVWVRRFVISIGYILAATFFYRQYAGG
jgi:uncharacterized membrane protein YfcA